MRHRPETGQYRRAQPPDGIAATSVRGGAIGAAHSSCMENERKPSYPLVRAMAIGFLGSGWCFLSWSIYDWLVGSPQVINSTVGPNLV